MAIREFKCPNCGGEINYDSDSGKLKCPYCDSEFEVEALKEYDDILKNETNSQLNWDPNVGQEWTEEEENGLRTYICKSCGGEIIGDENMGATSCPFCGNNIVVMEKFSGQLKPDVVIPFKKNKKDAREALLNHYKGKLFLPDEFKDGNHLDEIKGIYVPFWLFDGDAEVDIRYKGTKVRHWSDAQYDYQETSYYAVARAGDISFERVPVDGSSKMTDSLMESIEPYDFNDAVDFQTAYLAGYLADKYDVEASKCVKKANERIKTSSLSAFEGTIHGYTSLIPEHVQIMLNKGKIHYALYPVWILNTTYNNEQYTFAMNGQTGKFVGNLPMDKKKFALCFISVFVVMTLIMFLVFYMVWR